MPVLDPLQIYVAPPLSSTGIRPLLGRAMGPFPRGGPLPSMRTRFARSPLTEPIANPVFGPISYDAVSNSGYQTASSYSWSHTCTGSSLFLAVDISRLGTPGTVVTALTYNGVALTQSGSQSTLTDGGRIETWGLVNPASGTNTIAVTLSGAAASAGTAVSYANVNQTVPTEAWNSGQATSAGSDASIVITPVAANTWVHGAIGTDDGSVTANQTSRNNVTGLLGSGANEDNNGPIVAPVPTTLSYTGIGIGATWAMAGYAIRPIAAGGGGTQDGDGTAAGSTLVTGTGLMLIPASGTAAGSSTVAGTGNAVIPASGTAAGSATVTGIALVMVAASGTAAGVATVTGTALVTILASGTAAGTATVTGTIILLVPGFGTAAGSATVTGSGSEAASGTASGSTTVTGTATALIPALGTAAGVSTVTGDSPNAGPGGSGLIGSMMMLGVGQ